MCLQKILKVFWIINIHNDKKPAYDKNNHHEMLAISKNSKLAKKSNNPCNILNVSDTMTTWICCEPSCMIISIWNRKDILLFTY